MSLCQHSPFENTYNITKNFSEGIAHTDGDVYFYPVLSCPFGAMIRDKENSANM